MDNDMQEAKQQDEEESMHFQKIVHESARVYSLARQNGWQAVLAFTAGSQVT